MTLFIENYYNIFSLHTSAIYFIQLVFYSGCLCIAKDRSALEIVSVLTKLEMCPFEAVHPSMGYAII